MLNIAGSQVRSIVDEDGAVILDVERNSIVRLNSTGGFIWERLQAGNSIREIAQALAKETQTEIETVERDIREFLDDLKTKRLMGFRIGNADVF
jgi:hypothetical protein